MTFRTVLAMRVTQKVQFYTYVHLYISSLCPHTHIIYIYIYKYINAQVPQPTPYQTVCLIMFINYTGTYICSIKDCIGNF